MIYFVRCGHDGPIKIGHTRTGLTARLNFLQVGCPWQLVVMGTIEGDRLDEARLHEQFRHLHLRGEWFHPAAELLALIKNQAPTPSPEPVAVSVVDVKSLRIALGIPQAALAELVGVDQGTVSSWETAKSKPTRAAALNLERIVASLSERLVA